MQLSITLPDHVAAVFTDEAEAADWLLVQATDRARAAALAAASDQAQALLREAEAPFAGIEPPEVPTLAERLVAVDHRIDRVPALAVVAVEAALDAAAAIADGTPINEAKATAVAAVTEAITGGQS